MSFLKKLFVLSAFVFANAANCDINGCITFSVAAGTGCAWMCEYCANQLGTNNYYFTTPVCAYQPGGCVGNPITGVSYTCCSA